MEPDRKLAIATLQALIPFLLIEEKRLVEVITFSELPERRTQAEAGLKRVRERSMQGQASWQSLSTNRRVTIRLHYESWNRRYQSDARVPRSHVSLRRLTLSGYATAPTHSVGYM